MEEILIQFKNWNNSVEANIVRELIGALSSKKNNNVPLRGATYTTIYFEPAAIKLAAKRNIQLIDGKGFSKISNKQLKESLN